MKGCLACLIVVGLASCLLQVQSGRIARRTAHQFPQPHSTTTNTFNNHVSTESAFNLLDKLQNSDQQPEDATKLSPRGPADALQPQNVEPPFKPLNALSHLLLDEADRTKGGVASTALRNGTSVRWIAVEAKVADRLLNPHSAQDEPQSAVTTKAAAPRSRWTNWEDQTDSEDDTEVFNQLTAAIVNGVRILNGDVLERQGSRLLSLRETMQQDHRPQSEYNAIRDLLVRRYLVGHVTRRVVADALESSRPQDQLQQIRSEIDEPLKKEAERLTLGSWGVATREEVDGKLKAQGTSLDTIRKKVMTERMVGKVIHSQFASGGHIDSFDLLDYYYSFMVVEALPANVAWEPVHVIKLFDEVKIETIYDLSPQSSSPTSTAATSSRREWQPGQRLFLKLNADVKPVDELVCVERIPFPVTVTETDGEWLTLGGIHARESDVMETQDALNYYTELIRLNRSDAMCWSRRGEVWQSRGQLSAAMAHYSKAISLDPHFAAAYRNRGAALLRQGDHDGGIRDLTEAIRLDPKFARAYYDRGNAWRYKGKADVALQDYTEAIRFDAGMAEAYNNRGAVRKRLGDVAAAIKDFADAIRLDPQMTKAYFNRGIALNETGDYAAAIQDFTEILRLDPMDAATFHYRGIARHMKGDVDAAVKDYNSAIRLDPDNGSTYNHRGTARKSKGDFDAAIKDFSKSIRLEPTNSAFYIDRGTAWRQTGNVDAAFMDFSEALRIDPQNGKACNCLAWMFATSTDPSVRDGEQAVEWSMKACELSNWSAWEDIDTLAAAHAEAGEWESAVKRQEQAIALASDANDKHRGQARLELYKVGKPYHEEFNDAKVRDSVNEGPSRNRWINTLDDTEDDDDTEDFNRQTAVIVNGGRILNCEVLANHTGHLAELREELQRKQRHQSQYIEARDELIQKELARHIQCRLLVDAMEVDLPRERLMRIHARADSLFETAIEELQHKRNLATRDELEMAVKKEGSTLQFVKNVITAEQLGQAYYRSRFAKPQHIDQQILPDHDRPDVSGFVTPAKVEWEQVHISFNNRFAQQMAHLRMQQVWRELETGVPLAEVLKNSSDGLTTWRGWTDSGSMSDTKLQQMLFEMPIGKWSEIYEGPQSLQLVRVLARREPEPVPFNLLEDKVYERAGQKQREQWLKALIADAKIESKAFPDRWVSPKPRQWLGKQVFLKLNAVWKPVDNLFQKEHVAFPATVTEVNVPWLKLGRIWVRMSDVMEMPEALDYYSDKILVNPADARCWAGRGDVWLRKGLVAAAIADYAEAIRLDPKYAMAYYTRGDALALQGDSDAANRDYAEVVRLDPRLAIAYKVRGRDAASEAAKDSIRQALFQPNLPAVAVEQESDPWLNRKVFLKETAVVRGDGDAIPIDQIAFPAIVDAVDGEWLWLGGAWVSKHDVRDIREATKYYTEQLFLNPTTASSWVHIAGVWLANDKTDAAINDCTEAIRLDPNMADAHFYRGIARTIEGDYDAAIQDYNEAIRLDPSKAAFYCARGAARSGKGDSDGAVKDYAETIRVDPQSWIAYSNLASESLKHKNYIAAIEDYTKAVRLNPRSASTLIARGDAWGRRGEYAAAISDFTESIQIDPTNGRTFRYRGYSRTRVGDYSAAITDFQRAIRLDSEDAGSYDLLAWLLATCPDESVRNGTIAVELSRKACALSNWNERDAIATLAAAYAEAGDWENAIQRQEQVVAMTERSQAKQKAEERLRLFQAMTPYRDSIKDGK